MAGKIGGYVKDGGRVLTDGAGNVIGHGHKVSCTRIRPGAPGSWISNERCSYRFKVDGQWYAGRGYGDHMSVSLRPMKKPPKGFSGARKAKRRRRGLGFPTFWLMHLPRRVRARRRRRR